jgi:1,4-dihydroxy-2-naphthoate octaprenyltransferase
LDDLKGRIDSYGKRITKYDSEKAEIMKEARKFEAIRDDAQRHARVFGIAVIFLQIAILLSSVAALLKKKLVWYLGLVIGLAGLFYFVDGFLLFSEWL